MSSFKKNVIDGLSADEKYLSSRYFYDATGDQIFQEIMAMPEYYLTRAEAEIFELRKKKIYSSLNFGEHFNLVELGAGDGLKTKILLHSFLEDKASFGYYPIDISSHVLEELQSSLALELPALKVRPLADEYFEGLKKIRSLNQSPLLVLFLGSNIGNFPQTQAESFMTALGANLNVGDKLLLGVDMKKEPAKILSAYSDAKGITARFNLNVLRRINEELGANFEVQNFDHYAQYNPQNGECRSYLICRKAQDVNLKGVNQVFQFEEFECIHTEISRKYSKNEIDRLAASAGFKVIDKFYDSEMQFCDALFEKL
jgi:L-histidine N-alpha-methyltransferase